MTLNVISAQASLIWDNVLKKTKKETQILLCCRTCSNNILNISYKNNLISSKSYLIDRENQRRIIDHNNNHSSSIGAIMKLLDSQLNKFKNNRIHKTKIVSNQNNITIIIDNHKVKEYKILDRIISQSHLQINSLLCWVYHRQHNQESLQYNN